MAKEMKETTVSMEIVYDGVKTVLTRVIPDVGIEDGVAAMKKQCDLLTISPNLLEELESSDAPVSKRLDAAQAAKMDIERISMNEGVFRWMLNEDAMATEKLAEGIRSFASDLDKLRSYLAQHMETVSS